MSVGLFEGARYQPNGMYRSGQNCIMRDLSAPFWPVPAQTYVMRFYEEAGVFHSLGSG